MRLTIIGTGYVGLVAGAGFADFGNQVTCVDIDSGRINALRGGQMPIYEPGLREVVLRNAALHRLHFSTNTQESVAGADVVFLAVGTPSNGDGSADLARVLAAARTVAKALTKPCVLVVKSTVPVATGDTIADVMRRSSQHKVAVVSNPEFMKEGDALSDFMKPPRIVIGLEDPWARPLLESLYSPFLRTNHRILYMDRRSAEMTKYASNAMLATRISFMNELSHLASAVDADIESIRQGVGADPRIGNKFLFAGAGFGGSCFPKDLRAILKTASDHNVNLGIIREVERANSRQKRLLGDMIIAHFGGALVGKRIAVWGLAFKPKTDDVRESPAIDVVAMLREAGASVCAYDPEASENARRVIGDEIEYASEMYSAAQDADALALVTEWPCFRRPDLSRLRAAMRGSALFDGRNIWVPEETAFHGFSYQGIGRRRDHSKDAAGMLSA
jgi:UDPglucose 6-dehydrogenase